MPDPLRAAAETRLATLRQELQTGNDTLAQLEQHRADLREKLLRIAGAAQVLEEILQIPEEEPLCPNPNVVECMNLPSV
jgi:chromosome segregation ATPase